jgi:trehalose transport system permease protein
MLIGSREAIKKYRFQLFLMAPLMIYILGFTLGPVIYAAFISCQEKFTQIFPTLSNYKYIITHFQFKQAFLYTILITVISLTLEITVGLFLAVLLTRRFIGKGFLRALVLLPLGVPTIVAAANMRYIFSTQGYLNEILHRLFLINVPIDWTGGGFQTILTIALSDMWKVTPLVMLILLAGLENIPTQLYEAARIDGASSWQIFRLITLPLLKPFITIALIVRGIDAFRLFELPLTLVGSQTPVLSTYTYFEYFQYNNPYTSAASAIILLLLIIISASCYLKVAGKTETLY